jgi:hypothetical protein
MTEVPRTHDGRCLCGGIRVQVTGRLPPIQVCHCRMCQRAQGGAFAAVLPLSVDVVQVDDPEGLLTAYDSSPGKQRLFCRRCGSPVFSRRTDLPGVVRLRAGLLDGPLHTRIASHAHTASACDWWPGDSDAPRLDGAVPPAL